MSDEQPPAPKESVADTMGRLAAAGQQVPPPQQPPLPEPFNIPRANVARWLELSEDAPLALSLTRRDVDHLFFTIDHSLAAQAALEQCIILYTNNDLDAANAQLWESRRRLQEAQNRLRQFMNGIMAAATPG